MVPVQPPVITGVSVDSVSYEEAPLTEIEVDGIDYRLDPGRGCSVAVSRRIPGTWDWTPVAEGRWDGSRLRAKGLEPEIVAALADALGAAVRARGKDGVV
jgi:hypothetical protein